MLAKAHLDLRPSITRTENDTQSSQSVGGGSRSDDRDDELALLRWADDGGYCPPDLYDAGKPCPVAAIAAARPGHAP